MYKIRDKTTGLFAKGGSSVRWSKKGKIWCEKGHLSNHLAQFTNPNKAYEDCEIVELEIVERGTIEIKDWTQAVVERRNKRENARRNWREEHDRSERKA